jgi:hypothetical protein
MFWFKIGDVFDADDRLAVWMATLAVASNDLVHTNNKVNAATEPREFLYEPRVATGHYNEACLHMEDLPAHPPDHFANFDPRAGAERSMTTLPVLTANRPLHSPRTI